MIRLLTLGDTAIQIGRHRLGPEAELVFACTIFLAAHRGRRLPRQTLLELFWPRVRDDSRRHNLRQLLYKLRRTGIPCDADATHVSLRAEEVQADYDVYFSARVAEGDTARLEAPFGEFLAGYAPSLSPSFTEWLDHRRAEVHAQMRRVQLAVLSSCKQRGEWGEVDRLARRVLELDALNEEATLALAEATAMSGSKAAAVAMLDRYVEELGPGAGEIRLPAGVLRRRISDRFSRRDPPSVGLLFGRLPELSALRNALSQARGARGAAILIWGEAGLGKTRIAHSIMDEGVLGGALSAATTCRAAPPLSLLHATVPKLLALPGAIGCAPESMEALQRFGTRSSDHIALPIADAAFRFASVTRAFFDLLDAITDEGVLILLIDDADKLDDASSELLRQMCRWVDNRRTLIVATARQSPSAIGWIGDGVQLRALNQVHSRQLVEATAERLGGRLTDSSQKWCMERGAGNPLFLQELTRHIMSGFTTGELPPSLEALIDETLESLGSGTLRVLQAAALLGPLASVDRIEKLLQYPRHALLDALDQIQAGGLGGVEDGVLTPRHPLLAENALERCSPSAIHALHSAIARDLQDEILTSHSTALLWECLHHLRASGRQSAELELVAECVEHSIRTGVADEACKLVSEAIALDPLLLTNVRFRSLAASAYSIAGRWTDVAQTVSSSIAPLEPGHHELELLHQEARWRLDNDLGPVFRVALQCLESSDATAEHRIAAGFRAMVYADNMCDPSKADRVRIAMTTVPVTNPRSNILKLRASTIFECSYGTLGKSEEMGRLLVATERECGEPYHLSHALRIASVPLRRSGSRTEAEAMLAESLEISLRFRHAGSAAVTLDLLASLALERGDTEQARAHLDRIATLRDGLQEPLLLESVSRLELKYALVTGSAGNSTEVFLSPHHDSLRRAAETTAINCLIAARRSRLEHGQIDEMMLTHEKTRQFGGQDLVTNIVIGALIESGHDDRARSLLIDYLRIRRERFSFYLSPSLTLGRLALP